MSSRFLLFAGVFVLGACAYTVDEQTQDMTIVTPGAYNALCYAYIDDVKYRFRPPQTMRVKKSKNDLEVDCMAPGNRRQKVVIEPHIEKSFFGNVITGVVPGAAWDYASQAMFVYPDVVEVNFTNTPVTPEDLPAQNKPDIKQPEEYDLEEFSSGLPRLNEDRYAPVTEIRRRERPGSYSSGESYTVESVSTSDTVSDSKASPQPYSGGDINPAGPSASGGGDAPVPLFPGE